MSRILAEYRRLVRRRRKSLALIESLSEDELSALGRCIEIVQEHVHPAIKAAAHELSDAQVAARLQRGRAVLDMLVELSPNGDMVALSSNGNKERSWLFIAMALAVWERLEEQEEATQDILEDSALMEQVRAARERRGKYETVPWDAIR